MSQSWLPEYLRRIGYDGPVEATLDCLKAVHRAHACRIPYENLDVQLGRPMGLDLERIVEKIVYHRRGGWCYEMNGLLAAVLREIGFDVRLVASGVHRFERGDQTIGNHMLLLVELGQTYVADLGLGDGLREPIPLVEGAHVQGPLEFRLERLRDGFWRLSNYPGAVPVSFDFADAPIDMALMAAKERELRTSPESIFVQNLVFLQMGPESVTTLTGRVLRTRRPDGSHAKRLIDSAEELESVAAEIFGITDPGIVSVWPRVAARHTALFGDAGIGDIRTGAFGRPTED